MAITTVEKWYDRHTRSWVVQSKDQRGNQVGNATYVSTKQEAVKVEDEIKAQLPPESDIVSDYKMGWWNRGLK